MDDQSGSAAEDHDQDRVWFEFPEDQEGCQEKDQVGEVDIFQLRREVTPEGGLGQGEAGGGDEGDDGGAQGG